MKTKYVIALVSFLFLVFGFMPSLIFPEEILSVLESGTLEAPQEIDLDAQAMDNLHLIWQAQQDYYSEHGSFFPEGFTSTQDVELINAALGLHLENDSWQYQAASYDTGPIQWLGAAEQAELLPGEQRTFKISLDGVISCSGERCPESEK